MASRQEQYRVTAVERVNEESRQVALVRTINPGSRLTNDVMVLVQLPKDEFPEAAVGQLATLWFSNP